MLSGKELSLIYRDAANEVRAVDGVSLDVQPEEFIGILGPSGSGKSSLLYLLAGLKSPTSGDVRFEGQAYGGLTQDRLAEFRRAHFGFIFQNHFLINHLTSRENIRTAGDDDSAGLLDELHVAHCRDKFPWQMSAGEKQRVAIARAVVRRPKVVFADEPTASLDRPNADLAVECLRRVTRGGTLFVVTHDETILKGATRVLRMKAGRIESSDARP
jgi:putative ABC transport system ATP-binding protein